MMEKGTISARDVGTFSLVKDRRRRSFGSWLTKKKRFRGALRFKIDIQSVVAQLCGKSYV